MTDTLRDFLHRYCAAFRAGQAGAAAAFYQTPAVLIFNDRVQVLDSHASIAATLERALAGLIERGFSHSEVERFQSLPLTPRTALINAAFRRLRADGSVLERLGATYTVIDAGEGPRIATVLTHAPDQVLNAAR